MIAIPSGQRSYNSCLSPGPSTLTETTTWTHRSTSCSPAVQTTPQDRSFILPAYISRSPLPWERRRSTKKAQTNARPVLKDSVLALFSPLSINWKSVLNLQSFPTYREFISIKNIAKDATKSGVELIFSQSMAHGACSQILLNKKNTKILF